MDELKPCPFCGQKPRMKSGLNSEDKPFFQVIHTCANFLGEMKTFCYKTEPEAIAAWNRRAAPKNKPLTVEQLRQMVDDWVWLTDTEHPKFNGYYNVRPFHGGGDRIEFWGVDNAYYELAIENESVKAFARKPEGVEHP